MDTFHVRLESFQTLEELKTTYRSLKGFTEEISDFKKDDHHVVIVRVSWGSGDSWDVLYVYAFDGKEWVPRAVWDTGTRNVKVTFDEADDVIRIRSAKGVPVLDASMAAFMPGHERDW